MLCWYQTKVCQIAELLIGFGGSKQITKILVYVALIINVLFLSSAISSFVYGTIYLYHRPEMYHKIPVHFNYKRGCIQEQKNFELGRKIENYPYKSNCYPQAHVDLNNENGRFINEGYDYLMKLELELPESPSNMEMGMFMVDASVRGKQDDSWHDNKEKDESYWSSFKQKHHGKRSLNKFITSSKPVTMKYKSPLIQEAGRFFFLIFYLLDVLQESQVITTTLFDPIYLDKQNLNWTLQLQIDNPSIQIYRSNVQVHLKTTSVLTTMYNWPFVSFVIGMSTIFVPVFVMLSLATWFAVTKFFGAKQQVDDVIDESNDVVDENLEEINCLPEVDNTRSSTTENDVSQRKFDDVIEVKTDDVTEMNIDDITNDSITSLADVSSNHDVDYDIIDTPKSIKKRSRTSSCSSSSIEMVERNNWSTSSENNYTGNKMNIYPSINSEKSKKEI